MSNFDLPRVLHKSYTPNARILKSYVQGIAVLPSESPPAIIVYPGVDQQGDITDPEGGDWTRFQRNPVINLDHGPYIGTGSITYQSIPLLDASGQETGERVDVPVGTSKFFASSADMRGLKFPKINNVGNVVGEWNKDLCLRTAEQVAPHILSGMLNGTSVEMHVDKRHCTELGWNADENRPSLKIDRWDGLGYAHTHIPVHQSARMALDDDTAPVPNDAVMSKVEKALGILNSPMGEFSGYLRKSLTKFVESALPGQSRKPKRTVVAVKKAFGTEAPPEPEEEDDDGDSGYPFPGGKDGKGKGEVEDDGLVEGQSKSNDMTHEESPDAEPVPIGVKTLLTLAQDVMDACERAAESAKLSDNPSLRSYLMREINWFQKKSARLQSKADALGQSLQSGGAPPDLESDDMDGDGIDDADEEVDEEATETDAEESAEGESKPDGDGDGDESDESGETKEKKPKKKGFPEKDKPDTDDEGGIVSKSYTSYRPQRLKKSQFGPPRRRKDPNVVPPKPDGPGPQIEARMSSIESSIADILNAVKKQR